MATTLKTQPKTLEAFRQEFDPDVRVPAKIRKGLAALAAEGPEAWEFELDFCKRAGIGPTHIGKYRDLFAEHIVTVKPERGSSNSKNVWFGDAKVAKKARG